MRWAGSGVGVGKGVGVGVRVGVGVGVNVAEGVGVGPKIGIGGREEQAERRKTEEGRSKESHSLGHDRAREGLGCLSAWITKSRRKSKNAKREAVLRAFVIQNLAPEPVTLSAAKGLKCRRLRPFGREKQRRALKVTAEATPGGCEHKVAEGIW